MHSLRTFSDNGVFDLACWRRGVHSVHTHPLSLYLPHRVNTGVKEKYGSVSALSAGAYITTLYVMVDKGKSLIIWLIFFLFLQTKPSFCGMFAWSHLDFSAIPVPISAVSLTSRQTWQNVNSKRRLQRIQNVQEGKRHPKKETSSCLFLLFLRETFPTAEFWMISAETSCWEIERKLPNV